MFCWGILYFLLIDQYFEGFVYSFSNLFYFPMHSRNGIINFFVSIVYIGLFILLSVYIYVLISVCTNCKMQLKEKEGKNELDSNCKLPYLNWMK